MSLPQLTLPGSGAIEGFVSKLDSYFTVLYVDEHLKAKPTTFDFKSSPRFAQI